MNKETLTSVCTHKAVEWVKAISDKRTVEIEWAAEIGHDLNKGRETATIVRKAITAAGMNNLDSAAVSRLIVRLRVFKAVPKKEWQGQSDRYIAQLGKEYKLNTYKTGKKKRLTIDQRDVKAVEELQRFDETMHKKYGKTKSKLIKDMLKALDDLVSDYEVEELDEAA